MIDLLNQVDGHTVQTADGPWELHTRVATTDADVSNGVGVSIDSSSRGLLVRGAHAVATPTMVYVLLVLGLACLAFELTQPGFGFAGFAGLFLVALGVYGATVAVPAWPGAVLLLAGNGRWSPTSDCDGWGAHLSGAGGVRGRVVPRVPGRGRGDPDLPVADRGRGGRELAVLRVRADGGGAVARPDHRDAEGPDRAGGGGAGPARARRTRPREGRDVARPEPGRPDRAGHEGAGARRRRARC